MYYYLIFLMSVGDVSLLSGGVMESLRTWKNPPPSVLRATFAVAVQKSSNVLPSEDTVRVCALPLPYLPLPFILSAVMPLRLPVMASAFAIDDGAGVDRYLL